MVCFGCTIAYHSKTPGSSCILGAQRSCLQDQIHRTNRKAALRQSFVSPIYVRDYAATCFRFLRQPRIPNAPRLTRVVSSRSDDGTVKYAHVLPDLTSELLALDRCERRALSRRKFAIRALDAVRGPSDRKLRASSEYRNIPREMILAEQTQKHAS